MIRQPKETMNAFCRLSFALFLGGSLTFSLYAQQASLSDAQPLPRPDDGPIRFDHLTIEDGLSQQGVRTIVQDRHGFMWFGTWEGLNRYDGYNFKVYQHDPGDPVSLWDGFIRVILEDRDGMLWIGTGIRNGSLSRFDPSTETFTHYRHDEADPGSLNNGNIWALLEDRSGVLWVGTTTGLDRFDPSTSPEQDSDTGTFSHLLPVPGDPDDRGNSIYSILEDASGMLWVGTLDGLFRYDRAMDTPGSRPGQAFTRYRLFPEAQTPQGANWVTALYEDRQGTLWVGAWGLYRFDRETGAFEQFLMDPQAAEPSDYGVNRIRAIQEE